MDRVINIKVGGNYISKDNKNAGVRGEANVTYLRIAFDDSWNDYAKKITFWDALGRNPVERTLTLDLCENIADNTNIYLVPIPGEPMAESGTLTFVIDGYVEGKRQRSMSDKLEVKDAPMADNAGEPTDPTPTQAEQIQRQIVNLRSDIQQAYVARDEAEGYAQAAENAVGKTSYIGANGNWYAWDGETEEFYDTGVRAQGQKGDKGDKGDKGNQGIQGIQGVPGKDGYTPVKGKDYFTAEDIASLGIDNKVDKEEFYVKTSSYDEYINDLYFITGEKVNKENGKGLSSNDFTDEQRVKLEHINIITDSESSNHYQDTERILGFLKAGNYSNGLNIICTGDYSYEYGLLIVSPSDYKEAVYIDPFGYIHRFENETFFDEDWVIIGNPYATTTYIDNAIGDVETSLENIIKKYGLGGDGV